MRQIADAILDQLPKILPLEAYRLARGWSRPQALDELLGLYEADGRPQPAVNTSMLCRWEHGVWHMSADYEYMFCRLYGATPERLRPGGLETPRPATVTQSDGEATLGRYHGDGEVDPMRRRTLLTAAGLSISLPLLHRFYDTLAVPPQSNRSAKPEEAAQLLREARRRFDASDLTGLVATLPGLLSTTQGAAERTDTPAAWALLAASYGLATDTLNKIGNKPSARIAADRGVLYAERSGDPVAQAASARALGMMLRTQGRPDLALTIMTRGVDQLEATGLRTTAQAAMYLRVLCARAYTYAWANDRARAMEGIAAAERAASRIPAMRPTAEPFARLYRSDVLYALGDAGAALDAAKGLRSEMFLTPERRGRLHTDLARYWFQWNKPEQTTAALLTAHQHARSEVLDRPTIRRIAADLVERHPKVAGVRQLAAIFA